MARKRKPPKRRSHTAKALQSPLYRQRRKPSAKQYKRKRIVVDFETRSAASLTKPWEPETIIGVFAVERF